MKAWLHQTRDVLLGIAVVALFASSPVWLCRGVVGQRDSVKSDHARGTVLPMLAAGIRAYRAKTGRNPESLDALAATQLVECIPDDPWGRPYVYVVTEHGALIVTFGMDGMPGDDDITHWVAP